MDNNNEKEEWQNSFPSDGNDDANRDGNKVNVEYRDDDSHHTYNQTSNPRPMRPRFNSASHVNSDYHPRYNNNDEDGNARPRRPRFNPAARPNDNYRPRYNNNGDGDGENRPYRPRYNNQGGDGGQRPYRPRYNNDNYGNGEDGGQRPYRPRYNNNQGGDGGQRPYRPRYNNNQGGGYNNQGRYNNPDGGGYNNQGGYNNRGGYNQRGYGNQGGGYNNQGGYNSGYNGGDGGQRPYRPRYNQGGRDGGFRPRNGGGYNPNAKYTVKKQIEYKEVNYDPNEPIRLNKYLANAGVCSRREADEFIQQGAVSVNGTVVTELGTKVKRADEVKFRDQPVKIERKIYVLLNKPKNCLTTSEDPQERNTVMELVKDACTERIYPVGRLDRNTTGVLLLTNDGELASKLTHPKYLKKKIYQVTLDKNVTRADFDKVVGGIQLEDGEIHADAAEYVGEDKKNQVGIEIHSGKNRIVRRIFESLGYRVIKLDRVFFAGLTKKGLQRGEWRYLTEKELDFLRMGSFE